MSEETEAIDTSCECCASCGIAEIDDVKLKDCDGCDLARYCSDACRELHRPEHAGKCRKRAAELRDEMEDKKMVCASCGTSIGGVATPAMPQLNDCPYEIQISLVCSVKCQMDLMQKLEGCEEKAQRDELLFKQPEGTCFGDCPLCSLPLPIYSNKYGLYTCCSKRICKGCDYANRKRETEGRLQHKCPFCREALPKAGEGDKQLMKRVEANDPLALYSIGTEKYYEGDYKSSFKYWTRAVSFGDVEAHYRLGHLYRDGEGVEKDEKRAVWHLEEAAIAGHPLARHSLGRYEGSNRRYGKAGKHWIIAAKLGCEMSLNEVKNLYKAGYASKEDFAAALRGYQAAVAATKSPQREKAGTFKD